MIIPNRDNIKTIAAIHQQDAGCRVVIASLRLGGEVDVKLAETVNLTSGPATFTALIERSGGVDAVIRVLPGSCTVVRVAAIPDSGEPGAPSSPDSIADALSLMAETELPTTSPDYRRAAGMVNPGRGLGRKPVGLLTCWPPSAELHFPGSPRTPRVASEVGISEPAALAMLAQLVGGVERAWTVDRSSGAMTILAAGVEKTIVRVVRVPAGEPGTSARSAAISETSRAAGIADSMLPDSTDAFLHLEPAPASMRIAGQARSSEWVAQYGLAAAAIVAFADPSRAVSGLVELHEVEPKAKPPILQRISEWAGAPSHAAVIIGVCLLGLIALPIGASYAKLRILEKQIADQKELFQKNAEDDKELTFYKILREKRWPMTKLLADIAGACPQGITVESVEIGQGDGIVLRGSAEDTGKLSTFRENLAQTRVFADPTTPSVNPTGSSGVQFQLIAKVPVNAATMDVKPVDDWAAKTMAERMYGEKAAPTKRATSRSDRTDRNTSKSDRRNSSGSPRPGKSSGDNNRDTTTRADRNTPSTTTQPRPTPPPISDADIAQLTVEQSIKEFSSRKLASASPGIDEATKRRLLDEYEKIKAHKADADSKGGAK